MQPVRELPDVIGGLTGEVQAIGTRGQEFEKRLGELAERHRHNDRYAHQTRAELYAQQGRISILMQERGRSAQKEAPASIASVPRPITTEELGSLYLEFENAFRGSRADIKTACDRLSTATDWKETWHTTNARPGSGLRAWRVA